MNLGSLPLLSLTALRRQRSEFRESRKLEFIRQIPERRELHRETLSTAMSIGERKLPETREKHLPKATAKQF